MTKQIISLSDQAATRIKEIMSSASNESIGVRIGVKSGGCAGMSYVMEYAKEIRPNEEIIEEKGVKVIIAGAGGAAHLPGMIASITTVPVIGVPIKSRNSIDGWDSILSILQMPDGVPVGTVALNGSKNAGILAAQIIATTDEKLSQKVEDYKKELENKVISSNKDLKK